MLSTGSQTPQSEGSSLGVVLAGTRAAEDAGTENLSAGDQTVQSEGSSLGVVLARKSR